MRCRMCREELPSVVHMYPHNDGWRVRTSDGRIKFVEKFRWWIYVECPSCGYQNSFAKLKVPRSQVVDLDAFDEVYIERDWVLYP